MCDQGNWEKGTMTSKNILQLLGMALIGSFLFNFSTTHAQPFDNKWVAFEESPSSLGLPAINVSNTNLEVDFAWGDLDNDGDIDLVVARKEPFTQSGKRSNLLLMNENGVLVDRTSQFAMASDVPGDNGFLTPTNDRDVALADLDSDGWLDIITVTTVSPGDSKPLGHPRIYHNLGMNSGGWLGFRYEDARIPQLFVSGSGLPTNPRFSEVAVGDIDNDGDLDLYFVDHDSSTAGGSVEPVNQDLNDRLLINSGNGYFNDVSSILVSSQILNSGFGVAVQFEDFNFDGHLDLLKANSFYSSNNVTIAYGSQTSQFNINSVIGHPDVNHVASTDLNNDGFPDLVVAATGNDSFRLHTGVVNPLGIANFGPAQSFNYLSGGDDGPAGNIVTADLDGDGWQDVLIADVNDDIPGLTRRLHIYHNLGGSMPVLREERENGTGNSWIGVVGISQADLQGTYDIAVFDLDGDGDLDMIIGRGSGTTVWKNAPASLSGACCTASTCKITNANECAGDFHPETNSCQVNPCAQAVVDGYVDPHNHVMSEFAFGGGWLWGSVFGNQSVALASCDGGDNHGRALLSQIPFQQCPTNLSSVAFALALFIDIYFPHLVQLGADSGIHPTKTSGYPNYSDWPRWDTITHQQVWRGWLQDAFNQGVKIVVLSAVNFKFLCDTVPAVNKMFSCDEMLSVDQQLQAAHSLAMQEPWLEIATSPQEARDIISSGKMAMVLSIEASNLFGDEDLNIAIDKYYAMGVRSLQLVHQLNNRFGGTAHHHPIFFLAEYLKNCHTSFLCHHPKFKLGGVFLPIFGFDLDATCKNTQGLTSEGQALIDKMIERHMIIDLAHLSEKGVESVYTTVKNNDYYPLFISHGHLRSVVVPEMQIEEKTTPDNVLTYLRETGGMFGLRTGAEELQTYNNGSSKNWCHGSARSVAQAYELADQLFHVNVALSTDLNGFITQTRPRFGSASQGPCSAAEYLPERICQRLYENTISTDPATGSSFDTKGLGDIGALPEMILQVKNYGVDTTTLNKSAENFLRMWERAYVRDGPVALVPPPPTDVQVAAAISYRTHDERKSLMKAAGSGCTTGALNSALGIACHLVCYSVQVAEKHLCKDGGKVCKKSCKTVKKECKKDCKSQKSTCSKNCNILSGSAKRQCKKQCKDVKKECKTECKGGYTDCKYECKAKKKECKKQAAYTFEDCQLQCAGTFESCKCTTYLNSL